MRNVVTLGLAVAMTLGLSGCGGSGGAEGVMKDMLANMNEMTATLESIKDDASADAAIPKLEKQSARMKELTDKAKAMKLSPEEDKKLQEKYKSQTDEAVKKMIAASVQAGMKAPKKAKEIAAAVQKGMK